MLLPKWTVCRLGELTLISALFGCVYIPAPKYVSAPASSPWPHEVSDLKPDPAITWGRLENGLRYAILPRGTPAHRASVYLLVQVGSFLEQNDERGYAHFVEHLAFRDSRDFPGDSTIQTLQHLGLAFGPHVNATTSFFQTTYHLDNLASDRPGALTTGLRVLRSFADGVHFLAADVTKERGVISSERRDWDNSISQAWPEELEFISPLATTPRPSEFMGLFVGARLWARIPIGNPSTLRRADSAKLRAFYHRWYRPERMILAVTGAVEVKEAEQLVRDSFGSMRGQGPAPKNILIEDAAPVDLAHPKLYAEISAPEPVMRLSLSAIQSESGVDTIARRKEALIQHLALQMLDHRLDLLAEQDQAPFSSADTLFSHVIPGRVVSLLRAVTTPAQWPEGLGALDAEARRVREFGFTDDELHRAVTRAIQQAELDQTQAATLPAALLAQGLAFSVARGVVFTRASEDFTETTHALAQITAEECHLAFTRLFPPEHLAVGLSGSAEHPREIAKNARGALAKSREAKLSAPALFTAKPFPYSDFGPPGAVALATHRAIFDADLVQFANGVRLNFKHTEFEPGQIRATIHLAGGRLNCPSDQPGLDLRSSAWLLGGLDGLSSAEESAAITELSGGRSIGMTSSELAINFDETVPKLSRALDYFAAYFVHPAFREEGWSRSLEFVRPQIATYENTAAGFASALIARRMSNDHPSMRFPRMEEMNRLTLAELKTWFLPQIATAPLEITIVGDANLVDVIAAVGRTFGALPARDSSDANASKVKLSFPPKPFNESVAFSGTKGGAAAAFAWPMLGHEPLHDPLRGSILASILNDRLRLKLRNELGASYSLEAGMVWNVGFIPASTYVTCIIPCDPTRVSQVAAVARTVAATLAREGITAEELERARQPQLQVGETRLQDNGWLLATLSHLQTYPQEAESAAQSQEVYRTVSIAEINTLARTLFPPNPLYQLIVKPK